MAFVEFSLALVYYGGLSALYRYSCFLVIVYISFIITNWVLVAVVLGLPWVGFDCGCDLRSYLLAIVVSIIDCNFLYLSVYC